MKLYRLHGTVDSGVSAGYQFFASKKDAEKEAKTWDAAKSQTEITEINVTPTKAGILVALNHYASHPDNG